MLDPLYQPHPSYKLIARLKSLAETQFKILRKNNIKDDYITPILLRKNTHTFSHKPHLVSGSAHHMRDYKLVVLGTGAVGKSCLTVRFVQGVYMESYDPTIEDSYRKQKDVDGRPCDLEILDTAGVAQFTAMRELYIKSGQGFVLVYSVTDESSLEELLSIREQVFRIKDSSNVPMVLVGNKCDLLEQRVLSAEDGIEVSKKWGCVPFYETSAMNGTNVDDVFVDVVRQIMRKEAANAEREEAAKNPEPVKQAAPVAPKATQPKKKEKKKRKSKCVIL